MPVDGVRCEVYQVYYDAASFAGLDPGFLPLDNTANRRPDWSEFWVILQHLRAHPLRDDTWYGFLSPRFGFKTGLRSADVYDTVQRHAELADVALFSPAPAQVAYFLNVFEQGELAHPGLTELTQQFLRHAGVALDVRHTVMHAARSVFANYVVARKPFWMAWRQLAECFWDYVEHGEDTDPRFRAAAPYLAGRSTAYKVFVQERLASVVLSKAPYRVAATCLTERSGIERGLFVDDTETRRLLMACDRMKGAYVRSGDPAHLGEYWKLRQQIAFSWPG
jgi:hypothetical protein